MTPLSHEQVQANAAGYAALAEGDAERAAAFAHARTCPECTRALRQGLRLLRVLGEVKLPAPSPESLQRTRAQILAELRSGPRRFALPAPALAALAAVAGFMVVVLFSNQPRAWQSLGQSVTGLITAAACGALALATGPLRKLALALALFASAALVLAEGGPVPIGGHPGLVCAAVELAAAALPFAAVAWLSLRGRAHGDAFAYGGAAAAGALAGQAALDITCPEHLSLAHLWFHLGGVAVAALLGVWLSRLPPLRTATA